ncbi:MAG: type II toxin-antitoxin system YafQ family toxin [Gammaproteobacteria bacterium]|nr:type II toxin-antitoxin system YafQ family toxin [Gammaproteobacteria bacterium]
MRIVSYFNQFKKDHKPIKKRGLDESKLQEFVMKLAKDEPLPESARPYKLGGQYVDMWDAHIAPDWILIYEIDDEDLILRRTGTHTDLFK